MPQLNGQKLADRLLAIQPGLKVLFISGYSDTAIVNHGNLTINTAFLQKPFTPHDLVEKVREILPANA
jgi:FixJ family two-component response regulator